MNRARITSPDDASLKDLAKELSQLAGSLEADPSWPDQQLALCAEYGVFEWFVSREAGGQGWSDADIFRGYLALSAACLTTTFIITQRSGACRRIEASQNDYVRREYLPGLVSGEKFATVGISHLTTSRRHVARPVLRAEETPRGFVLDGFSPWVTGGAQADVVVIGASLADGRQILVAVPMDQPGVTVPAAAQLVGLTASQTGPVQLQQVTMDRQWLLAGPVEGVMAAGSGASTGGLQTSALALGLASGAIAFVEQESRTRRDLSRPVESLRGEWERLRGDLLSAAEGHPNCSNEQLRTGANSLVLRAAQAALATAKGSGYVVGHPAGRWCREALFFLVWSCPQPVMAANLCELAGISV